MTGIFHILDVEGAVAWNPVKQHEGKLKKVGNIQP